MKLKYLTIFIIIVIILVSFSFDLENEINFGDEKLFISFNENNLAIFDQIDINLFLYVLLDSKTYNKDIDALLNEFYLSSKDEIDEIRIDFLDFLYTRYHNIKSSSSVVYAWYRYKTGNLKSEEIIYNILKKRYLLPYYENSIFACKYASMISSQIVFLSFYSIIYKYYFGEKIIAYKQINEYIVKNYDKIINIIHQNKYYFKVKNYFNNFIISFNFKDLYSKYRNFYNLQGGKMYFYLNWYPSLFSRNGKMLQGGTIIEDKILLNGFFDINNACFLFLHEIAHFYNNNLFKNISLSSENPKDPLFLALNYIVKTENEEVAGEKVNLEKIKSNLYDLILTKNINLFSEFISDFSIYYFLSSNNQLSYLMNSYEDYITYFFSKDIYYFKAESNLYYELIKYTKDILSNSNGFKPEEFLFNMDVNTRDSYLKNILKDFVDNALQEILNSGRWIKVKGFYED